MRIFLSRRTFLTASLLTLLPSQGITAEGTDSLDELRDLMAQRLAIMPGVAAYKWTHDLAIEDLGREAEILRRLTDQAVSAALEADFAQAFFKAQIDAAKSVQRQLHQAWQADARPRNLAAPDLKAEVRPALDRLTPRLLTALKRNETHFGSAFVRERFYPPPAAIENFPGAWAIATRPLLEAPPS